MSLSFEDADYIFRSEKRLLHPLRWVQVDDENKLARYQKIECRVEIDGGVPRGTFFRIISQSGSLNNITFQLECEREGGNRTRLVLYRFEMNPSRPHQNKLYGDPEINGLRIDAGVPHEHVFDDSLKSDGELRSRPDEQGRIVPDPPIDFATAFEYVCSRLNIINGGDTPPPKSQGDLL